MRVSFQNNQKRDQSSSTKYTHCLLQNLNLKLSSEWKFEPKKNQKKNIVHVRKLDAKHMLPSDEIFIRLNLKFQTRVLAWVLLNNSNIYAQYNSSCETISRSNLANSLNS